MPAKPLWTESDLEALIGQTESIRREFKSGRIFDEVESKWLVKLCAEVSALANTEGGELFLGIDEDKKSRPRVATKIDGAPAGIAPERLQQLIEGNVSPYLPGIRLQRVRLSTDPDKVVFVIQVPQGSTAYQAKDGRYYGRSEFEVKFLPDHEVRLRMSRGRVARGVVTARVVKVELGAEREKEVRARHAKTIEAVNTTPKEQLMTDPYQTNAVLEVMSAQTLRDRLTFDFVFRNDGELTIHKPVVQLSEIHSPRLFEGEQVKAQALPMRVNMDEETVYPGDEQVIGGSERWLECKRDTLFADGDYVVRWKVFLDNSPPSSGEIDLGVLIQTARDSVSGD